MVVIAGRRTDPEGGKLAERLQIELPDELPSGIVAVVDLVEVRRVSDLPPAERQNPFVSGPYCWSLERPRLLAAPIPYRGNVRLMRLPRSEIVDGLPAEVATDLHACWQDPPEPSRTRLKRRGSRS